MRVGLAVLLAVLTFSGSAAAVCANSACVVDHDGNGDGTADGVRASAAGQGAFVTTREWPLAECYVQTLAARLVCWRDGNDRVFAGGHVAIGPTWSTYTFYMNPAMDDDAFPDYVYFGVVHVGPAGPRTFSTGCSDANGAVCGAPGFSFS